MFINVHIYLEKVLPDVKNIAVSHTAKSCESIFRRENV